MWDDFSELLEMELTTVVQAQSDYCNLRTLGHSGAVGHCGEQE